MTFKCVFGYEKDGNFICSYDKQPCECPIGSCCRVVEQFKDDYIEQINWEASEYDF